MRERADRIIDSTLLLYILKKAAPIYGRIKVQKSTFLVELRLRENSLIGPHFRFIRYLRGPFSRQIWDTYDELAHAGFVHRKTFEPTERGNFLIEFAIPALRKHNPQVFELADEVLDWCKRKHAESLIRHVYQLEVAPDEEPTRKLKVSDIPMGWDIIVPPAGGLNVPPDLAQALHDELAMTNEDLMEAKSRLPEIEEAAFANLERQLTA